MQLFLVFILLFFSSATPMAAKNVFILSGQSNMFGYGGLQYFQLANGTNISVWDGVVPPESYPNPQILRLNENLQWEVAFEPLHKLTANSKELIGIGPGMPFANTLLKRDPAFGSIGLVPCAVPGSNISSWSRGSFNYLRMLRRARAAISGGGVLRALLWYQGESETLHDSLPNAYRGRLMQFFSDIRADLRLPSLPIIQVALASNFLPLVNKIREVQLQIDIPNVKCVDAAGLPTNSDDNMHLLTPSQVQLGSLLADAFLYNEVQDPNLPFIGQDDDE